MGALVTVVALFFIARPVAVFISTARMRDLSLGERWFISWVGARGAISAALASLVVGAGIIGAMKIFNIVLVVVVATLLMVSFTAGKMALRTLDIEQITPIMEEFYRVMAKYLATREAISELDQHFQEGSIDVGTLRELRSELKQTLLDREENLESFYSHLEVVEARKEEKIRLMRELLLIKLATAENLRDRGDLPESVYRELIDRYKDELEKLSLPKATPHGLLDIIKGLRGLIRR